MFNDTEGRSVQFIETSVDVMNSGKTKLLPYYGSKVTSGNNNKIMPLWILMLTLEIVIYGSYSILVNLSKENDKLPYKSGSVVLIIELTKLMLSIVMFIPEFIKQDYSFPRIKWSMLASFAIPAILYTFNNNVSLHMQLQMDPTTFQVLNNLKIATTALMYKLIIKRTITRTQWIALSLLTIAGVCDSFGGLGVEDNIGHVYITWYGLVAMVIMNIFSSVAAVHTEFILKQSFNVSLHFQNILLYIYGVIFNTITFLWQSSSIEDKGQEQDSFFKGFSGFTWLIILNQASSGLIMSVVMKHGSNLTRLFIISGGMLTSTLLSILVFSTEINIFFLIAALLVTVAIYLYHL
ncbi:hypothetical protein ACF0H5_013126 [Mactra antiquata]